MQVTELGVSDLFEHGRTVHPEARVVHYDGTATSSCTFAELADQAARLAGALDDLGVFRDDVVATLCWNVPAHLAAYFAVPSMGAVLHTLNLRLSDDQLVYIINHAADRVVLVNGDLVPQLARLLPCCPSVQDVIVVGEPEGDLPGSVTVHDYDELLSSAEPVTQWPTIPERSAAVLCYTTGTTGDPKGVAYSHRSIHLHTLGISTGNAFAFNDSDRVLPIVPMFHANAWGWPYAAWLNGSDLVLPDRYLQPPHLAQLISEERVTAAAAVPTLWSALDDYGAKHGVDFTSLRLAVSGGSALSAALTESLAARHGVRLTQGWGMTETSPLLTFSRPPAGSGSEHEVTYRTRTGRIVPGVRARIVDDEGTELPWDGATAGEVELRGATITGAYFRTDPEAGVDKFRDGWLRTGDLGVIHPAGWVELKDRLKDGIKSGGEWISSIELENAVATHPAVSEAVVVGVPDARWEERPLVCVKLRDGATVTSEELRTHLEGRVAKWWLPERWAFVTDIPKTSVGKLDKKRVRADYDAGLVQVVQPSRATGRQ
ncbi:long-chain fatty acid--CoA ligase [Saccharopolyspora mangrovi]|uniref:Long-chain fatty acid--CoA ligase n=1 Tax=Saccharopolyspora mangrovi TaxID=3082379 RepID=A0ABU6AIM7_9PSEU|nr:long-chain fatty acid--CoA ligase [Saccharopolyspora sp. S2-29]MEB3371343.1 long-chain fatty acid--CoA ligase [Saccharopolyspora sp. S2-29]